MRYKSGYPSPAKTIKYLNDIISSLRAEVERLKKEIRDFRTEAAKIEASAKNTFNNASDFLISLNIRMLNEEAAR